MNKYNIFIVSFIAIIFLGLIINMSYQYKTIIVRKPPHYNRRYGLAPHNCPFRYQYY
jgi:hypothetical protein